MTQLSGSVGGATASRNKGGSFVRARIKGTDPNSALQIAQRAKFSTIASTWRDLTDVERTAWADAAPSFPYTDSLGQVKIYSGFQLYASLNGGIRSANAAASLLTSPPSPVTIPTLTASSFTVTNDDPDVAVTATFAPTTVPTGFRCKIYATTGMSAGVSSPASSAFKLITSLAAGASISPLSDAYSDFFALPAVGSRVFMRVELISTASGQKGITAQTSAVVVAA